MEGEKIAHELYVFAKFGLFEKAWLTLMSLQSFLGRFQIFENRPLDPVLSLRVISEKKQICESKSL